MYPGNTMGEISYTIKVQATKFEWYFLCYCQFSANCNFWPSTFNPHPHPTFPSHLSPPPPPAAVNNRLTSVGSFVNFEIFTSGEHFTAGWKRTRERLFTGVNTHMVHQLENRT